MSKRILVCGSLAFDTIAVFEGHFKDHIIADNVQALSVSFFVPGLRKEYGGCAGNIAYNLRLLGSQAIPVGTLGVDGIEYLDRFKALGIDTSMVQILNDHFSAQCFITTDLDSNQIASFHPGAMLYSADNDLTDQSAAWGIVAPDSKDGMFAHAKRLYAQGTPFVFDLGQAMPLFDGEDLEHMLSLCSILTANEYEADIISQRTGRSIDEIAQSLQAAVITKGAKGATLYEQGQTTEVAPIAAETIADPTGCGDSHRAGLLHGLTQGWSLFEAACLGNVMGSIKIASKGPQNHTPSQGHIQQLLKDNYGVEKTFEV